MPSEYGVRKSPLFFLHASYWCPGRGGNESDYALLKNDDIEEHAEPLANNFEPVPENLKDLERKGECLKIRNLRKVYDNGKLAVDGLSLTMYEGQIFALLGHNGAGKTTTISMLTGLYAATSGGAQVFGLNVFQQMPQVRTMLGVCPQHDVLFEQLNPREHLEIFASFKGVPRAQVQAEVTQVLEQVDLIDYQAVRAKSLSGGQKRKLSVGIALIGGSKLVLLDEPTSGMDPTARRRLWDMLKSVKRDRILILTTHYMEEADILGDRIAITALDHQD